MMTENISLFDLGTLGLLAIWALCWAQHLRQERAVKQVTTLVVIVSSILLLVAVAWRGLLAGHWPLISAYEFCLVFVWAISAAYCVIGWRTDWSPLGLGALPISLLLAAYARWGIPSGKQLIQPIAPVLRSPWLPIHVIMAALAYGFFAVACGAALWWFVTRQPDEKRGMESSMAAAVKIGYVWLTASMIAGAVWAQMAWGSYWRWDPKEIWTLVIWLIYTLFLHARYQRNWAGRPLAVLALLGFIGVMFIFLGISPLVRWTALESLHVF